MHRALSPLADDDLVEHFVREEAPRHADAIVLLEYWRACMANGGFVVGRDIPARKIARILRSIILWEPLADGSDLCVRLAGADVRRRFDFDLKGRTMSTLFSRADFQIHLTSVHEVIVSGLPIVLDTALRRGAVEELRTEVLILPVTASDMRSTWLLAGLFYF
jgi:hypothetical protein